MCSPSYYLISVLLLLVANKQHVVEGLATGAAGCPPGILAVDDLHLSPTRNPQDGSLASAGISVTIGGNDITSSTNLKEDTDYTITITSTTPFRGALIRAALASGDSFTLTPVGSLAQVATVCVAPAKGVTHTSAVDKTTFSATFRADEAGTVNFDITVVFFNNANQGASHRYTGYQKTIEEDIAPTPAPAGGGGGGGGGGGFPCFSGNNIVEVEGKGLIPMNELRIGDYVKVENDKFSRVYSFGHLDPEMEANFVQIYAHGLKTPLELSHDHMLYVGGMTKETIAAKRSRDVKVGDYITIFEENHENKQVQISKIEIVKRRGVYNPITENGNIVVSSVLASCYVNIISPIFSQWSIHAILSPFRLACKYNFDSICMQETYTDGITNYYYYFIQIGFKIAELAIPVQMGVALILLPLLVSAYMIEQILMSHVAMIMTIIALLLITLFRFSKSKKIKAA